MGFKLRAYMESNILILYCIYVAMPINAFFTSSGPFPRMRVSPQHSGVTTKIDILTRAPFDDIIPFLSEHIQPADQILFIGASTDLCLQLSRAGYGTVNTGFLHGHQSNNS